MTTRIVTNDDSYAIGDQILLEIQVNYSSYAPYYPKAKARIQTTFPT